MPQQLSSTHTVIPRALIVYQPERSSVWQCRIKVGGRWVRRSTKELKLADAIERARELMVEAEIRRREGLPAVTKRFRDVAQLAIKRMQEELDSGSGKSSYKEYILIIERYLIPVLGKRLITNIDNALLLELEARRREIMGRVPKRSTLLSHNAALNKVFDEAVLRGVMASIERPELQLSGKKSERHAAFEPNEVAKLLGSLEDWITKAKSEERRQGRELLRDYVEVLLGTGARPGKELMNLKWSQIKVVIEQHPTDTETYWDDELHRDVEHPKLMRHLVMKHRLS